MLENDVPELRAMITRTIDDNSGLDAASDYEWVALLMRIAYQTGFRIEHLVRFTDRIPGNFGRTHAYGIVRNKQHSAGVIRVYGDWVQTGWRRYAIFVRTTGLYGGAWVFITDLEQTVYHQHDGKACETFNGLEGPELIGAVLTSALADPLDTPAPDPDREPRFPRFHRRPR